MQLIYIPKERVEAMEADRSISGKVEKLCRCRLVVEPDDTIEISGDPVSEFSARNIVQAFGRGFDMAVACKLLSDDYYFESVDLGQLFGSPKRVSQVRARIIGRNGKSKRYIEEVSGARLSVYGDTVSFIGTMEEIREAQAAVDTLIEGGTHRLAYMRMEAAHRKNKEAARMPAFR